LISQRTILKQDRETGAFSDAFAPSKRVIPMQVLLTTDTPKVTFPLPIDATSDPVLASHTLQHLGERLRQSYDMAREPVPVRLAELVERLARREQAKG
jgi:hypothetical protein